MIIATAGHVDHGKTSLVRNLTGIETDRLAEEKRRGLSINLGYAYQPVDDDHVLGFIDVPGHSRFINSMISGISGVDLGMLVVAADDGPMPQTREHLHVLNLLGIERYILVISKVDMVDANRATIVAQEVLAQMPENTEVFHVSNIDGEGIDQLRCRLNALCTEVRQRDTSGFFRMSVDRAFHVKGSGLVVTGTVSSGAVEVGDTLIFQPQSKTVRVRGIHAQNRSATRGINGQRCAINITGDIERDDIDRGDWLAHPDSLEPSARFDTWVRILPEIPFELKHMSPVKVHLGAKRLSARIALLGSKRKLVPGEGTLAQIISDRPALCCHGDRILLRDYGEAFTIGGGVVLDPNGLEYRRSSDERAVYLNALRQTALEDFVEQYVLNANGILNIDEVMKSWNRALNSSLVKMFEGVIEVESEKGRYWLSKKKWAEIVQNLLSHLNHLHLASPREIGVKPALLKGAWKADEKEFLFRPAIDELICKKKVSMIDGLFCSVEHQTNLEPQESPVLRKLKGILHQAGRKIPTFVQLEEQGKFRPGELSNTVACAVRHKQLIKVSEKRVALPDTLKEYAAVLADLDSKGADLSVINFRDCAGCGRNLAVEILEYFDAARYTQRTETNRKIIDTTFLDTL